MYCRCSQHRTLRSRSQQQDDAELNATHAENQPHLLISATQLTEIVAVGYHLTVSLNGKHWRARTSVVVIVWLPPLPAGCDARQQPRPLEPKQCVSVSMWVCLNGGPKNAEVWSGYFECLNVAIIVYRAASYQCKSIYLYQFAWHTIQKSRVSLPGVPTILPHMYHTSAVLRCVSRTQFPSGAARAHSVFSALSSQSLFPPFHMNVNAVCCCSRCLSCHVLLRWAVFVRLHILPIFCLSHGPACSRFAL